MQSNVLGFVASAEGMGAVQAGIAEAEEPKLKNGTAWRRFE